MRLGSGMPASSCRYESLDSLQHLSSDGFQRPWLPSYANLAKLVMSGMHPNPKYCYVTLYWLDTPRWRTLLRVAAGRMTAARCVKVLPPQPAGRACAQGGTTAEQAESLAAAAVALSCGGLLHRSRSYSRLASSDSLAAAAAVLGGASPGYPYP